MVLLKSDSVAPQQHTLLKIILLNKLTDTRPAVVVGIYCHYFDILAAIFLLNLAQVRRLRTTATSRVTPECQQ